MALWKFSNLNKYGNWRHRIIAWPDGKPFSHGPGFGKVVGVSRFKYTYEHPILPPSIIKSVVTGKTYIVPAWMEVLPETTLNDIEWIKPEIKKTSQSVDSKPATTEYKFESKSEPGSFYVVRVTGDKVKCNCAGQYRAKDRQCKHMKEVRQKLGL
jgi:hypothetical protein